MCFPVSSAVGIIVEKLYILIINNFNMLKLLIKNSWNSACICAAQSQKDPIVNESMVFTFLKLPGRRGNYEKKL